MSNSTNPLMALIFRAYDLLVCVTNHLQSPLLLLIRLAWGIQFAQTGYGKLHNIEKVTGFFTGLNIPFPMANAYLVGCTEMFGGILLTLGLFSRPTAIPLSITLIVAYITSEQEALQKLFSFTDVDPFFTAAPFLFLLASVIVLVFGPGAYSVDYLIARWKGREWKSATI
jgi:putative oxidoreductase